MKVVKLKPLKLTGLVALLILFTVSSAFAFELKVEKVTDRAYALVGPLHGRSFENHALNNTMGFIVTDDAVVLIDSGATAQGAALIEHAVASVTDKKIKWVINTGAQDHRWLGNGYFASKGAKIIALARTVENQKENARFEMQRLKRLIKDRLKGTEPTYAKDPLPGNKAKLTLGSIKLEIIWPGGAHFPDDVIVWLPSSKTVFTGDLVFIDRMLALQRDGSSNLRSWAKAFKTMAALSPEHIIPGHGHAGNLARAKADTGDYLDWLIAKIKPAVSDMEDIQTVMDRLSEAPFHHLANYDLLQRQNVNRAYLQLEIE